MLLWVRDGTEVGGRLGSALTTPGDATGDGIADILAGAPAATGAGVWGYSGADGTPRFAVTGPVPGIGFGTSILDLQGDLDGNDGIPEIVVGAPLDSAAAPGAGAIYVVNFAASSVLVGISGTAEHQAFGRGAVLIPDTSGDTLSDVLVSGDCGTQARGCFSVIDAVQDQYWPGLTGAATGWQLGHAVIAGSLDGSLPRIYVGSPGSDGGAGRIERLAARSIGRAASMSNLASFLITGNAWAAGVDRSFDGGPFQNIGMSLPVEVASSVSEGEHQAAFRGVDSLGRAGPTSAWVTWSVDLTPPDAPVVLSPAPAAVTSSLVVTGTASDPIQAGVGGEIRGVWWAAQQLTTTTETIQLWWDGFAYAATSAVYHFQANTSPWAVTVPDAGPAEYELRVFALDAAYQPSAATAGTTFYYQP
jgi:hypothetical protein